MFSDGFVVEFQGDSAILPEEIADMDVEISKARVEESLASGAMRTMRIEVKSEAPEKLSPLAISYDAKTDGSGACFLSFGAIAENIVYVDITREAEYQAYLSRYRNIDFDALDERIRFSTALPL